MIDLHRKAPRFHIVFEMISNKIEGKGVNISQKGIGFLFEDELVPADNIPFKTHVKGYIFSNKVYTIEGTGRLLYSQPYLNNIELYYNGFEFVELTSESEENLYQLLNDVHQYHRCVEEQKEKKTLSDFNCFPSNDIFDKAQIFSRYIQKSFQNDWQMYSYYLCSKNSSNTQLMQITSNSKTDMIMLGSNNYLGLTGHPDVMQAASKALHKYGTGNGAGAMVGGTMDIHKELERALADFTGKEDAIIFNSGYSTNIGVINGLLRPKDAIINDQLNHASIYDGCTLSRAKVLIFNHNDVASLERVLKRAKLKYHGKLIIVDGIYSTDGTIAPLDQIVKIARNYDCRIMVDEAHSFGVLGERGAGAAEYFNCCEQVDIIMATMSKALGGVGGFVAASKAVIDYLRFYSHSYLFSTNIPPATAGGLIKALEILRTDKELREKLRHNIQFFKSCLEEMGLNIGDPAAAVIPVFIPDVHLLMQMSADLFKAGVFHNVMNYPAVPMGGSLLRFGIMATHTQKELKKALSIIEKSARELKLI